MIRKKKKNKVMFEIQKGQLHFWVLDAVKPVIVPDLNTIVVPNEQLMAIRNSLVLSAKYWLKKVNSKDEDMAMQQYFAGKGWTIRRLRSPLYANKFGDLFFSF